MMSSDILLNFPIHPNPPAQVEPVDPQPASDFLKSGYQMECRLRCQNERKEHARICREYLEKSFEARIKRAQERAMVLAGEAVSKSEYKLTADEAMRQVDELQRVRQDRMDGLGRLELARTGPVRHIASAIVVPPDADIVDSIGGWADEIDPAIRTKSEIAAEDCVIAQLIADGFPESQIQRVGPLKLGFDIRAHRVIDEATGQIEVRRIEVKGRMQGQPIRLTTNEWYKAQQLADTYWLSVVWDPLSDNRQHISIHNPVNKLDHAKREVVAARYFEIPAEAIDQVGEGQSN